MGSILVEPQIFLSFFLFYFIFILFFGGGGGGGGGGLLWQLQLKLLHNCDDHSPNIRYSTVHKSDLPHIPSHTHTHTHTRLSHTSERILFSVSCQTKSIVTTNRSRTVICSATLRRNILFPCASMLLLGRTTKHPGSTGPSSTLRADISGTPFCFADLKSWSLMEW